jgi:hypothetical protein
MSESLQLKFFNEKVRAMNQANAKILTLNAQEARNLQAEIYELMAIITSLTKPQEQPTTNVVSMDGGGFK